MEIGSHGGTGTQARRRTDVPAGGGAGGLQCDLWAGAGPDREPLPAAGPVGRIERFDYYLSEPDTTNNRMALRSAIVALDLVAPFDASHLSFVTDSNYIVLGMTRWVGAWRARGWRRKGGPIENLDLWRELEERAERRRADGRPVDWRWVRGHAGHAKNEYANALATRAAAGQDASGGLVPSGFPGWLAAERTRGRYVRFDPDEDFR